MKEGAADTLPLGGGHKMEKPGGDVTIGMGNGKFLASSRYFHAFYRRMEY